MSEPAGGVPLTSSRWALLSALSAYEGHIKLALGAWITQVRAWDAKTRPLSSDSRAVGSCALPTRGALPNLRDMAAPVRFHGGLCEVFV